MSNPFNSDLVGEARRLSEAATPGPWKQVSYNGDYLVQYLDGEFASWLSEADAEFIARARTLLPELAQQLEQAEQRADEAEEFISRQGMRQAFNQWKPFLRAALTPDGGVDPGGR